MDRLLAAHGLLAEIGAPNGKAPASRILGTLASALFSSWPELAGQLIRPSAGQKELTWREGERARFYNLQLSPLD